MPLKLLSLEVLETPTSPNAIPPKPKYQRGMLANCVIENEIFDISVAHLPISPLAEPEPDIDNHESGVANGTLYEAPVAPPPVDVARVEDVTALKSRLERAMGMNRDLAVEALRLIPDLNQGASLEHYTEVLTQTHYTSTLKRVTMESEALVTETQERLRGQVAWAAANLQQVRDILAQGLRVKGHPSEVVQHALGSYRDNRDAIRSVMITPKKSGTASSLKVTAALFRMMARRGAHEVSNVDEAFTILDMIRDDMKEWLVGAEVTLASLKSMTEYNITDVDQITYFASETNFARQLVLVTLYKLPEE